MNFPVKMVIFSGPYKGKEVAQIWLPFASQEIYDTIEAVAGRMADEWSAEIDILLGSVMPSGRIEGFERAGMRVRPQDVVIEEHRESL